MMVIIRSSLVITYFHVVSRIIIFPALRVRLYVSLSAKRSGYKTVTTRRIVFSPAAEAAADRENEST